MRIGTQKKIDGRLHEVVRFRAGEPIWREVESGEKLKRYIGQPCRIVGLMPRRKFDGEITSVKPLLAKITEADPVWFGCVCEARYIRRDDR